MNPIVPSIVEFRGQGCGSGSQISSQPKELGRYAPIIVNAYFAPGHSAVEKSNLHSNVCH